MTFGKFSLFFHSLLLGICTSVQKCNKTPILRIALPEFSAPAFFFLLQSQVLLKLKLKKNNSAGENFYKKTKGFFFSFTTAGRNIQKFPQGVIQGNTSNYVFRPTVIIKDYLLCFLRNIFDIRSLNLMKESSSIILCTNP